MVKIMERIDDLGCKGLKIIQNTDGFCFGMDAVLLSDFAKDIKRNAKVIDLGTGTGIIATLLCGKTDLKEIIGVEVQKEVCEMARRSIELNNLQDRFSILEANIKDLDKKLPVASFDAIVTNPPYKRENTGLQNEKETKLIARHEILCNLEDIVRVSGKLLKDKGVFYMVHRPERLVDIFCEMRKVGLEPKKIRLVKPKENAKPNIVLIKAVKNGKPFLQVEKELTVYEQNGDYTDEILKIYEKER